MRTKQLTLSALVGVVAAVIAWFLLGTIMHGRMAPGMMERMHGHTAAPMTQERAPPAAQGGHGAGHVLAPSGTGPMGTVLTGDPDKDFAQEMIVHHEMAVEMAKDALAKGKDPEIKTLAEEVIAAQTKEIEFLRAWLAKQPK